MQMITKLQKWKWPCSEINQRAIDCMMKNVMALQIYIQRMRLYYYQYCKLRDGATDERTLIKQKVTLDFMEEKAREIYKFMTQFYDRYSPLSVRMDYEFCQEYPFSAQGPWG